MGQNFHIGILLKFIYSEKATKFCEYMNCKTWNIQLNNCKYTNLRSQTTMLI